MAPLRQRRLGFAALVLLFLLAIAAFAGQRHHGQGEHGADHRAACVFCAAPSAADTPAPAPIVAAVPAPPAAAPAVDQGLTPRVVRLRAHPPTGPPSRRA